MNGTSQDQAGFKDAGKRPKPPIGKIVAATAAISLVSGFGYGFVGTAIARSVNLGGSSSSSMQMPGGGGGGADTMKFDYTGSYSATLTADGESKTSENETTEATESDQNAALAQNSGTLTIKNATLNKSGDSDNADNNNFYGTNSVSLTVGEGSKTVISDSKINSESSGSNAIFATDSGTALVNNTTITTSSDNSRGLDATYGGTILGNKLSISTKGNHCASLATDRGGGSISATDSTLSTAGSGSPLLYSTGDIEVSGVTGTASGSQIAGMEGLNTIIINKSTLTSTNTGTTGSDPVANGVIIYQSTSGDAEASTGEHATFQAKDSTLKSAITSGAMLYFTNTTADVVLSNTTLDFDSSKADLINAAGNDSNNWGSAGSNGATVTFTGRSQTLKGNVSVDTISSVALNLLEGTTWTGAASITENANGSTSDEPISVSVDGTSTWVVTKNTTISALHVASGGKVVDSSGKTVTIVADGKTVVSGDSDITVTVNGTYDTTVDAGDETKLSSDLIDRSDFDSEFGTSTTFSL